MNNAIKNKVWRVSLVSVLTGIIISIVEFFSSYFIAKGTNEWTLTIGNAIFWIGIILATVIFLITGLLCFRDMSKTDIAKSAIVAVLYHVVIVALEQLLLSTGQYTFTLLWLFIPVRLYMAIHQLLLRFTEIAVWISLFLSIITPLLYVVFGKKESNNKGRSIFFISHFLHIIQF